VENFDIEIEKWDQDLDLIKAGEIMLNFVDEMRLTYAQYTRNHNDVAEQLKKVSPFFSFRRANKT
jgi:hypothetical protein